MAQLSDRNGTTNILCIGEWIVSEQEGGAEWSPHKFYSFSIFRRDAEVKMATLMIGVFLV
jgi:hypothetical protein